MLPALRPCLRSVGQPLPGAGGGKKNLDIRASVGTSTSPTSTGTKPVTGVGFQPKVVLPFGATQPNDGVSTATANIGFGAATSSSSGGVSVSSLSAVTTSQTNRRHAAKVVSALNTSTTFLEADYSAFGADGFTLDWTTINATARILNHIALGGADLEVSLTQQQMNGTNAAQSFAHGLSGAPTGVLFFSVQHNTIPPSTTTFLTMSIGAFAGSNQFAANVFSRNGVTTTNTNRLLKTTTVFDGYNGTGSVIRSMAVSSVDATNVNVTYPVTADATQNYFWMLCIRGAKCQVGTFNTAGSTSPLTITTTGITPKLFLPAIVEGGVQHAGTVLQSLLFAIGASDGINNVSCGISDTNGNTTTEARRYQSSTTLVEYATDGSKKFEGTAAFSGESVILTPTTHGGVGWGQGGYLVIGK